MLRNSYVIAIVIALGAAAKLRAQDAPPSGEPSQAVAASPDTWATDWQAPPEPPPADGPYPMTLDEFGADPGFAMLPPDPPNDYLPMLRWFGLRHSHTHGRNVGRGKPLVGTSWINRPYYIGGELGTLWLNRSVYDHITRDTDAFGGFFLGWDRDPYWGGEIHFDRSTPELVNREARDARRTDSLFMWNYNVLYYPWGDAKFRPFWRAGIGNTRFDFPLDNDSRHDEWMLSFPFGIGMKYPVRRWLAARAELTNHLTTDGSGLATQNNLTLTFGLEWRFGAHPRSYWPWNPSRHIW